MANRILGFKSTRATSPQAVPPDSPLHARYLPRIFEEESLVPIRISRLSIKKKAYEVDTGTPPSKNFKAPSFETSQIFSHRWILLPPEELANAHTHPYSLDTQTPSSQTPYHPFQTLTLSDATYKHNGAQIATMPYNNTAIPPPEEITGVASLPLARVKKILHIDEEIIACSNNGAFAITIATEMFIRYLAEQALNVVKSEKKPRRNIQYKDMANAVARMDCLQFLEDVIPRTSTFREYKAKKASKATKGNQPLQNGQTTLDAGRSLPQRPIGTNEQNGAPVDDGKMSDGTISEADPEETRAPAPNTNGGLVFEHYEPNGSNRRDESGDVEMG